MLLFCIYDDLVAHRVAGREEYNLLDLLRGAIVNRTYRKHKNIPGTWYIFTDFYYQYLVPFTMFPSNRTCFLGWVCVVQILYECNISQQQDMIYLIYSICRDLSVRRVQACNIAFRDRRGLPRTWVYRKTTRLGTG